MTEIGGENAKKLFQKYGALRNDILKKREGKYAPGELFFPAQETHFIVPASQMKMLEKAASLGCEKAGQLLAKFGISGEELARSLNAPPEVITRLIAENSPPDLVLVDGEDANALNPETIAASRENAVKIFTQPWGGSGVPVNSGQERSRRGQSHAPLRFYRPSGFELEYCLEDLLFVLLGVSEALEKEGSYPIDGVIYPKPEDESEIGWVCDLLGEIEHTLGLPENSIAFEFLAESARGFENLSLLTERAGRRLTGVIFGLADYGSEIGVTEAENHHPAFDAARLKIANAAAAGGVAAIDAMTFRYPVADPEKTSEENKAFILERMKLVYDHTLHAIHLGMAGKWVGHPLQMLAVKAAFETAHPRSLVETKWEQMKRYANSVEENRGATIISGNMADRATDRQTRAFLRKAVKRGEIQAKEAEQAGLISQEEAVRLNAWQK